MPKDAILNELLDALEAAARHDLERLGAELENRNPYNCLGEALDAALPILRQYGRAQNWKDSDTLRAEADVRYQEKRKQDGQ